MAIPPTGKPVAFLATDFMTNRNKVIDNITDDDLVNMLIDTVDEDKDCRTCKSKLLCANTTCSNAKKQYILTWLYREVIE